MKTAPKIVSITATSRCNLRCVMCDHGVRNVAKQDFQEDLLGNIGDFVSKAKMVDLTGLGEPLLSNFFWRMIDQYPVSDDAKDEDFFLTFNTNGTLLNQANIDRLLRSRLYKIRVSIDSANPDVFSRIRGTPLAPIIEATKRIIQRRNSLGRSRPRIGIEMTLMQNTISSVPSMIDLCNKIGADFLEVWSLNSLPPHMTKQWKVTRPGWTFEYDRQSLASIPDDAMQSIVDGYHRYAELRGVAVASCVNNVRKMTDNFPRDIGIASLIVGDKEVNEDIPWQHQSVRCDLPWQELRVTYEGDVFACCWQQKPVGNIKDMDLASVWSGETMQQMRADLIAGKIPELCYGAGCSHVKGYMPTTEPPTEAPSLASRIMRRMGL